MGAVRPFVGDDILQVANIHRRIYRANEEWSPALELSYKCFFQEVYLNNPWYDESLCPLVYEEGDGRISAFMGVMPRPMRMNGQFIQAAVSSMFMVDPNNRNGLAAIQLSKAFLSGPQDLSLADESTSPSRKIWEGLGGVTSLLYSMYWTRPLRLARFLNLRLGQRNGLRSLAKVSAPLCWVADATLARMSPSSRYRSQLRLSGEDLDLQTLIECSQTLWDSQRLHPEYDEHSLSWLLDMAKHAGTGGTLEKVAVRNSDRKAVGWYVYYLTREGVAEVLQFGSRRNFTKDVRDHLLHHAWKQGAVAVTGRLDSRSVLDLGSNYIMSARYWMLAHSRKPELLNAIDRGEPYLSRIEGEWCMQFHMARYQGLTSEISLPALQQEFASESSISVKSERGGVEVVDLLGEEWRRLCDEGHCQEPFYRPEWVAAYIRAFAPRAKVVVVTARIGGVLKAVLPLIEEQASYVGIPVTKLRGAANAHSCRFDLVRAAGADGDAAVRGIWRLLEQLPGWDLIELPNVPEGGALDALLDAARLDAYPVGRKVSMRSPYLPLSGLGATKDPLLLQTSPNFRAIVRRKGRQLKARGDVVLRRVDKADPQMLKNFYELEQSGWKGKQGTAIACSEETRQFYDEIARNGERFGYLSMFFLDFNGHTVAAQFGVTHGGRYFMPKLAFDENYKKCGPGHLLIHEILRDCVEHGISEYDFTGPWAEYKAKWTSANRPHFTLWIFRKGTWGNFLHAMKFKFEANLKKMLRPKFRAAKGNGSL